MPIAIKDSKIDITSEKSSRKLAEKLTDAKEWEQVKAGFKEMGKTLGIVDEAEGHDLKDKIKAALGKDTFAKLMKLAKAADE